MQQFIQYIVIPGLSQGALFGLIAVAFAVLHQTTAVINFAHGQLVVLAPIAVLVFVGVGMPVWLAVILSLIVLILVSLLAEWATVRPFVQSGSAVSWILSTFGASVVLAEVLAIPGGGDAMHFPYGISAEPFTLLGFRTSWAEIAPIPALLIVATILLLMYRKTRMGQELRAVGEDVLGAEAIGISRARASQIVVVIAGLVAAITGYLVASAQVLMPSLGMFYLFSGFVAVAMGGMNSVAGAVIGGLVVGLVSQAAAIYIGPLFTNTAMFVLLIAVYVFRPFGIFGSRPVREV
nr:branched-chain amino acid ABC transporter permease [Microbacterium bovistercoris]